MDLQTLTAKKTCKEENRELAADLYTTEQCSTAADTIREMSCERFIAAATK